MVEGEGGCQARDWVLHGHASMCWHVDAGMQMCWHETQMVVDMDDGGRGWCWTRMCWHETQMVADADGGGCGWWTLACGCVGTQTQMVVDVDEMQMSVNIKKKLTCDPGVVRSGPSEGRGQRQPNNQHPSDCDNARRGPPKLL